MNFVAERAVQTSPTIKVLDRVKELTRAGEDVVSLSAGEPDSVTPQHIREYAKQALDDGYTFYPDSRGLMELREAIAEKFLRDNRIEVDPKKEIVVTVGGKEAIYAVMMATIDPGDEVIVSDPCWVSYVPCVKLAGGKPVYMPLSEDDNFRVSAERLEKAISKKTKMLIINSPNNPLGTVVTRSELETIADLAKHKKFLVLSDELYEKIIFDNEKHVSIASLSGMKDYAITVNGFSKSLAMTGWRLGYLESPSSIAERVVAIHGHLVTGACTFAQRAAALAMQDPRTQKSIEDMVSEYSKRRDLVVNELAKDAKIACVTPKVTFYVFPNISGYGLSSEEFSSLLLEKCKVAVLPGDSFGPGGRGFIRLSFATSRDSLIKAFNRIEHALSQFKVRTESD